MQYGFFKHFSQILVTLMTWVHKYLPNWGVAIIVTTLILKIVFLPFTLAASRSAKRMQKIQPEMQAVREKFKDNPQKLQAATMELFKKHKVNPLGGCIPILITMPFFFGFFTMLQSAAELRFEPFLWAADLSAPDTVAHVFGFPVNIMPLLMGATMIYQMRLTPQPAVDNAQAKMLKFMPYIFILFCYTFSCALALYSTINGLFTIGQQLVINRMKDEGDAASPGGIAAENAAALAGKPMKNVTPKKKR
jgi:YidC/Oxa1 family membrane protein insertase